MSTVRWAVRFPVIGQVCACTFHWVTHSTTLHSERSIYSSKAEAFRAAANWPDARLVKITRKPKVKAAQREAWEGRVCLSPSGFHSSKLIGVTDVVSLLSLRLSATPDGTLVRVTLETLPEARTT